MTTKRTVVQYNEGKAVWVQRAGDRYLCIGKDVNGKRFRMLSHSWRYIEAINCYQGRKYLLRRNKRYLLNTTSN